MRIRPGRIEEATMMCRQAQLNRGGHRSAVCRGPAGCDHAKHEDDDAGERAISIPERLAVALSNTENSNSDCGRGKVPLA
jgi:hypothetical protein